MVEYLKILQTILKSLQLLDCSVVAKVQLPKERRTSMTSPQIRYWEYRENQRHNRQTEALQQYGIDTQAASSKYAADMSYAGTVYSADQHYRGTVYSADKSYAGTVYSADRHYAASVYAADSAAASSRYATDVNAQTQRYVSNQNAATQRYVSNQNAATQNKRLEFDYGVQEYNQRLNDAKLNLERMMTNANVARTTADTQRIKLDAERVATDTRRMAEELLLKARQQDNADALSKADVALKDAQRATELAREPNIQMDTTGKFVRIINDALDVISKIGGLLE